MRRSMKVIGGGVLVIALGLGGYAAYFLHVVNPRVVTTLKTEPNGELAQKTAVMTFSDGKTIPVNYLQENDRIFLGADAGWWRRFRAPGAEVTLLVRGESLRGHGLVVLDDPAYTKTVFARLRPDVPGWLPDWLNGKLIVVSLAAGGGQ